MQAAAPSPEQQWDNIFQRLIDRANGIPDLRALRIDIQEALIHVQRLKEQLVGTRDEAAKVWKERAEKAEARVKELETKYELQPKKDEEKKN